jgi:hypothetical protein
MLRNTILRASCLVLAFASPRAALAADKAACSDAYTKAQTLRDENKLLGAREQLRICARPGCTAFIVRDCASWLGDVESRIPSVVLYAKDANGAELSQVSVSMDGTALTQQLDGRAIEVDPGPHAFVFTLPDGHSITQSYPILEGQKAQRVGVALAAPPPPPRPGSGLPDVAPAAADSGLSSWTPRRTAAVVLAGVGAVGVGIGSYFGLTAQSQYSHATTLCSVGSCPLSTYPQASSDRNTASTDATVSTVAFAAAGALIAAGVVLFVTAPRASDQGASGGLSRLELAPSVGTQGAGLWLRGGF